MSDMVNHPPHYTDSPSGTECIDVVEHMSFCIGNAIKYLWRAGKKGPVLEDLAKARWYIDREIARLESKTVDVQATPADHVYRVGDKVLTNEVANAPFEANRIGTVEEVCSDEWLVRVGKRTWALKAGDFRPYGASK